jgi:hypothetical protein
MSSLLSNPFEFINKIFKMKNKMKIKEATTKEQQTKKITRRNK